MAVLTLALVGERWLDEIVIAVTKANIGADVADTLIIPANLGDVALMEMLIYDFAQATAVSTVELGAIAFIQSAAGNNVDFVGTAKFHRISATASAAYFQPDPLVLIKSGEVISLSFPELDSNASPTDDMLISVKLVRVRPQEVAAAPLRLVR